MAQEIGNSTAKTLADLYDHEKVRFIHPVINAQWHAKVGLLFLYTLYKIASYRPTYVRREQKVYSLPRR